MVQQEERYTVITGASSGIGYETAKAFAARGKNLVIVARRQNNLATLKNEIQKQNPTLDIVIKVCDLSVLDNAYRLYSDLKGYALETWVNNAGFGNYDSVAQQDLEKVKRMLRLNVEALTILSSLFVRDYKDFMLARLPRDYQGSYKKSMQKCRPRYWLRLQRKRSLAKWQTVLTTTTMTNLSAPIIQAGKWRLFCYTYTIVTRWLVQ